MIRCHKVNVYFLNNNISDLFFYIFYENNLRKNPHASMGFFTSLNGKVPTSAMAEVIDTSL